MGATITPKNLLIQIQEIHSDSKIGKDRHFNAGERKGSYGKKLGLSVIIINVLIGSSLISNLQKYLKIEVESQELIISFFALLAAGLAAIQTFFDYAKEVENHRKIGNLYLEITKDSDNLLAKFNDGYIDKDECQKKYEKLVIRYKEINIQEEICVTSNADYKFAFSKNKKAKERIRQLKEKYNYSIDESSNE